VLNAEQEKEKQYHILKKAPGNAKPERTHRRIKKLFPGFPGAKKNKRMKKESRPGR
jgi:hypothetical protein